MSEGKAGLLRVSGRFELSRVKLQHMNEAVQGNLILLFKASKKYNKSNLKGSLRGGPCVIPLKMRVVQYTQTESDRLTQCTVRLTGSQVVRDLQKYGRWASERVEMLADRVDRTRAVTTRLPKRDPTKGKSVRATLKKIWQIGFREGRNVGEPYRSDTGRHDPSNKTRPDKGEVSSRET